jgi:hypothetical protein
MSTREDQDHELTAQQLAVKNAKLEQTNVAVIAGAGSGKTFVLVECVQNFLQKRLPAEKDNLLESEKERVVVVATFARPAAQELRERLLAILTPEQFKRVKVGTLHALANDLCESEADDISNIDECQVYWLRTIQQNKLRVKIDVFFVDECQDLNDIQVEIVLALSRYQQTVCVVVGDDDQQLYGFRGSSDYNTNRLITELKCQVLYLTVNFRSSPEIVALANQCAAANRTPTDAPWQLNKPAMTPWRGSRAQAARFLGQKTPLILDFDRFEDEVRFLENDIARLQNGHQPWPVELHDIAVITRYNNQLYQVQGALFAKHIPSVLASQAVSLQKYHVQLFTIHGAKGLEFTAVYVLGLGKLPDPRSCLQDERRQLYVAITRAKRFLTLTHNKNPSLFVAELEPPLTMMCARWSFVRADGKTGSVLPRLDMQVKKARAPTEAETRQRTLTGQPIVEAAEPAGPMLEVLQKRFDEAHRSRAPKDDDNDIAHYLAKLHGADYIRLKNNGHMLAPNWHAQVRSQMASEPYNFQWPEWCLGHLKQEVLDFLHVAFFKILAEVRGRTCRLPMIEDILKAPRKRGVGVKFYSERELSLMMLEKVQTRWRASLERIWHMAQLMAVSAGRLAVVHIHVKPEQLAELLPHLQLVERNLARPVASVLGEPVPTNFQELPRIDLRCHMATISLKSGEFLRVQDVACLLSPQSAMSQSESLMTEVVRAHALVGLWRAVHCGQTGLTRAYLLDLLAPQAICLDLSAWSLDSSDKLLFFLTAASSRVLTFQAEAACSAAAVKESDQVSDQVSNAMSANGFNISAARPKKRQERTDGEDDVEMRPEKRVCT